MLKVWPYWIVRPKAVFIAAEGALMGVLLLYAAWMAESHSAPRAAAGVLGLVVALLACQVTFYFNKPGVLILDSNPQRFLVKTLQSVAAGLVLTMLLSWIFPGLFHGYGRLLAPLCWRFRRGSP